jgi:hypothetical protein
MFRHQLSYDSYCPTESMQLRSFFLSFTSVGTFLPVEISSLSLSGEEELIESVKVYLVDTHRSLMHLFNICKTMYIMP